MGTIQNTYAIPGTNYAMTPGKSSDQHRQQRMIDTIITNTIGTTKSDIKPTDDKGNEPYNEHKICAHVAEGLKQQPYCFIADTDSTPYVLDSGANRFILNNSTLFEQFQAAKALVKGIGGNKVSSIGQGKSHINLQADDGTKDLISIEDAVYVPTSPYNLIPPQLLIRKLRQQGYETRFAQHDDSTYIFKYRKPNMKERTLTIPISANDLFMFNTNEGYKSFFAEASSYCSEWCMFAGNAHVIPNDDGTVQSNEQPRESPSPKIPRETTFDESTGPSKKKTKFSHDSTQQSSHSTHQIPFENSDFAAAKINNKPNDVDFGVNKQQKTEFDPQVEIIRRKQARLATLHERLGHTSFSKLKLLARAGHISRDLADVDPPTCPGCAYGKAHRKPWRSKGIRNLHRIKPATKSGQVVSVDQLISPTPGFVPTHRGIPTTKRYKGATVFVDHYSDFTYVHLMTDMDAAATVLAKQEFERVAAQHHVTIQHYHCDNGLFDTKAFRSSVQKAGQTMTFCGVNAHHQNGRAEARIKDVTTGARTALQHAAHRWPNAINATLWPASIKHYTNLKNSLPTEFTPGMKDKRDRRRKSPDIYEGSPISKFSGTQIEPNLEHFHPFGSPVYVLKNALQAKNPFNKWQDRARVGIFLCHSPKHAANVSLILNTQTGNVSPQFHCIYDNAFDTCKRDAKFESIWQYKAKLQERGLVNTNERQDQHPTSEAIIERSEAENETPSPPADTPLLIEEWENVSENTNNNDQLQVQENSEQQNITITRNEEPQLTQEAWQPPLQENDTTEDVPITYTRSGRAVRPPPKFKDYHAHIAYLETYSPQPNSDVSTFLLQPDVAAYDEPHPFALLMEQVIGMVSKSDPDTMYLEEALNQPDRAEFIKAMHKELQDHVNRGHWKVVSIKTLPKDKTALPMVWSMKRKRNPIGEITKWKARLCAGGHKSIEFIDYWSTYSPVVSWSTVRLMIIMALINEWHMQSIDFVLAFPQAPVKTDIYMKPPKVPYDFKIPDLPHPMDRHTKIYKLIKNLYGLKDASKTWFDYLHKGLVQRGWKQSEIDTCLFTKDGIMLVVYVDDAILISPQKQLIDKEILSLQKAYDLTDDGELKDYLGTRFVKRKDGSIELSQPKMIERVLKIVGLDPNNEQTKQSDTPADSNKILDNDPDGKERKQSWNYRSAVGCLSYLQAMIRPDITFATQQCARFCNAPQRQHEEAVKRICRYLLKTKDRGLILKPDRTKGLECYCDADWAGSWVERSSHDPLSSHSRTGFVLLYAGCPILWSSKRQQLIALSTTEAEYIALSSALREVIGVIHLLEELRTRGFRIRDSPPKIVCRTFEDNKSCIEIATNHKTRARTKHLSVRLHHFRHHVVHKTITIQHVSTTQQLGDIYTKPLARPQFEYLRNKIMSWPSSPTRE